MKKKEYYSLKLTLTINVCALDRKNDNQTFKMCTSICRASEYLVLRVILYLGQNTMIDNERPTYLMY